jgi:hypothetical protein
MAAGDFVVLNDLKRWLGLEIGNTKEDDILSALITNLTAAMLNKINRAALLTATYTETRSGNGSSHLALKNFPVTAISSLTVNGVAVLASPDGIQAGYVFDIYQVSLIGSYFGWPPPGNNFGANFNSGTNNVVVVYTAGYATIPLEVSQACKEWCAFKYRQRSWIGQTSKHLATGETVSFSQKDMPDTVAAVLQQYQRRIPV